MKKPGSVFIVTAVNWVIRLSFLVGLIALGYLVYQYLISNFLSAEESQIFYFMALWVVTAYIVLPRIHRRLTKLYLPNYFIGRARNGDGLLSDPINIAFVGSGAQLRKAMFAAGWKEAEPTTPKNMFRVVKAFITGAEYPNAPVSSLYLFNRKHNFAFQIQTDGIHARHHVRFWRTPKPWWLPGGSQADWLGAGTYDRRIMFSALTWQIDHKIAENTDEERDFILQTLTDAGQVSDVNVIKHFSSAFHDRNGGGDMIKTDGSLPIVTLKKNK